MLEKPPGDSPGVERIECLHRGFNTAIPSIRRFRQYSAIRGAQRCVPVSENSFKAFESSCRKLSFELWRPG
jgi:hypothetical protein